jgi:hypothetical protein
MTRLPVIIAVAAAAPLTRGGGFPVAAAPAPTHWVDTWVSMPQLTEPSKLPLPPFTQPTGVLTDTTVRQTIHISIGGRVLRLRFSNAFGGSDLPITAVPWRCPRVGRPVSARSNRAAAGR